MCLGFLHLKQIMTLVFFLWWLSVLILISRVVFVLPFVFQHFLKFFGLEGHLIICWSTWAFVWALKLVHLCFENLFLFKFLLFLGWTLQPSKLLNLSCWFVHTFKLLYLKKWSVKMWINFKRITFSVT